MTSHNAESVWVTVRCGKCGSTMEWRKDTFHADAGEAMVCCGAFWYPHQSDGTVP